MTTDATTPADDAPDDDERAILGRVTVVDVNALERLVERIAEDAAGTEAIDGVPVLEGDQLLIDGTAKPTDHVLALTLSITLAPRHVDALWPLLGYGRNVAVAITPVLPRRPGDEVDELVIVTSATIGATSASRTIDKDGVVTDTVKRIAKGKAERWGSTLYLNGEVVAPYVTDPQLPGIDGKADPDMAIDDPRGDA